MEFKAFNIYSFTMWHISATKTIVCQVKENLFLLLRHCKSYIWRFDIDWAINFFGFFPITNNYNVMKIYHHLVSNRVMEFLLWMCDQRWCRWLLSWIALGTFPPHILPMGYMIGLSSHTRKIWKEELKEIKNTQYTKMNIGKLICYILLFYY